MSDSAKPPLLLLCHRIPFPPDKGDKIRSYHLLKYLAEHYSIFLGAFVDDPQDWGYQDNVRALCKAVFLQPLSPKRAKLKSLTGLLTGDALSIPYYRDDAMQQWVDRVLKEGDISRVMVFSSTMAQYVFNAQREIESRVVDLVDIDSDKWRQYADKKPWPMNWIYRREAEKLFLYEQRVAESFDRCFFVSEPEANHFIELYPSAKPRVHFYNNGVDSDYFSPDVACDSPFSHGSIPIVFTGAMDYWPNVDAVTWFAERVLPDLRQLSSAYQFYVVGRSPTSAVKQLQQIEGVTVTGRVEDVRPFIQHAAAVVAPMRIARGVQNKVLEAMSMAKPVVVTPMGLEGIKAQHDVEVLIANTPSEFVDAISSLGNGAKETMGHHARQHVQRFFNWQETLPVVSQSLGMASTVGV